MDSSEVNRTDVRDITSDDDNLLEAYGKAHMVIAKAYGGSKGLYKSQNFAFFNDWYRKGKDVRNNKKSFFTYTVSPDEQKYRPEFGYLMRVLKLCTKSDICTKLGMSAVELMNLDLDTFTFIEEYFSNLSEKEDSEARNIINELKMDKM